MDNNSANQPQDQTDALQQQPSPSLPPLESAMSPPSAEQQQSGANKTDVIGIISIIMPFAGFAIIGVVLGVIGVNKAKAEGYSPTLSRVGLIISTIFTLFFLFIMMLFFGVFALWS